VLAIAFPGECNLDMELGNVWSTFPVLSKYKMQFCDKNEEIIIIIKATVIPLALENYYFFFYLVLPLHIYYLIFLFFSLLGIEPRALSLEPHLQPFFGFEIGSN
jgi:hypothetical protein